MSCFLRLMLFSSIFHICFSHFFAIPSHFLHFQNIFYDFYDIIRQYSATKIAVLRLMPISCIFPCIFPCFSSPLPTITFPAFSQYFLAIFLHFPKLLLSFPLLTPHFLHLRRIFFAVFPHFPMFLRSCPPLTITFLSFSPYFLRFP